MIFPKNLQIGSRIAIVSPSGRINPDLINSAKETIARQGFEPIVFPSANNTHFRFAGTDSERLSDLQSALDDHSIDAILCSRGGYGLIRIIDSLDFTEFSKIPKWIIGFSDITILHLKLNNIGIASIHAQMVKDFSNPKAVNSINYLQNILIGNLPVYNIQTHPFNKEGVVSGELIGGNLSIIYSLQGTEYEINTQGKILFIEDLGEHLYHLDRIMNNLRLSQKLRDLKALIIGSFTEMIDENPKFGMSAYEIISEYLKDYSFPVCFGFPLGHTNNNFPLIVGGDYCLSIDTKSAILKAIY